MGVKIKVEIDRLKEAQAVALQSAKNLRGGAIFGAVQRGTLIVFRDAVINTTVVTGRLRAGYDISIGLYGATVIGVIRNPVEYFPYYELGTRKMAARRPLGRSFNTHKARVIAEIIEAVKRSLP